MKVWEILIRFPMFILISLRFCQQNWPVVTVNIGRRDFLADMHYKLVWDKYDILSNFVTDEQLEKSKIAEGAISQEEQNGANENHTIKVCDTNQSVLTSEPQSMKETQVKVCKEPIEVTRAMEQLSDTQSSSSCSDPIEKYSVSSSEKVSCSSPTDTTLRQPPPTGLRPTSTSPDNAKRPRARKNTAERLLFSVQKTQSQKERPGGHSPLLPKSGGWTKEDRASVNRTVWAQMMRTPGVLWVTRLRRVAQM